KRECDRPTQKTGHCAPCLAKSRSMVRFAQKKTTAVQPCIAAVPQDVVNSNSAFSARVFRHPSLLFWVGPPLGNIVYIGNQPPELHSIPHIPKTVKIR